MVLQEEHRIWSQTGAFLEANMVPGQTPFLRHFLPLGLVIPWGHWFLWLLNLLLRLPGHPGFSFWWNWVKPQARNDSYFSKRSRKVDDGDRSCQTMGGLPSPVLSLLMLWGCDRETDYSSYPKGFRGDHCLLEEKRSYVSGGNAGF